MELSQRRERLVKRLGSNRARARERLVLVEGIRATTEAVEAGARVSFAVTSPRLAATPAGPELAGRLATLVADRAPVDVVHVEDDVLAALADTEQPQGVLLVCEEPMWSMSDLSPDGPVLVLDAIQDPGNVGTLVRSAAAFGFPTVLALDGTGDPWGSKAVRASAGTVFRIAVGRVGAQEAVATLRAGGWRILVASAEGEGVGAVRFEVEGGGPVETTKVALVLGNEGAGVRPEVRGAAHATVGVAMNGPVESLNVGIAGSILMHELTREGF